MEISEYLQKNIHKVEVVVFDIDGVLIDTTNSYPQAICNAIEHYGRIKNIPIKSANYNEIIQFKKAPGFNNDWDLAEGLLMYKIAESSGTVNNIKAFLRKVREKGEGLSGIHKLSIITDSKFDRELIRRLTMEHYAGQEYCSKLYGFEPIYFRGEGTIKNEKIILDRNLWEQISKRKAILTGRNREETAIALDRLRIRDAYVIYEGKTAYTKPSPELLKIILNKMNANYIIFAGDSYDDYQTVRNFSQKYGSGQVYFVQILRKGTEPFKKGISFAENINDLIKYLIEQRRD